MLADLEHMGVDHRCSYKHRQRSSKHRAYLILII